MNFDDELKKLKNKHNKLLAHLEDNPRDYEAVTNELILKSDIIQIEKKIEIETYKTEIDKYR